MSRRRLSVLQIINHLREAEVLIVQGKAVGEICRRIRGGGPQQSHERWRRERRRLKVEQARRLTVVPRI